MAVPSLMLDSSSPVAAYGLIEINSIDRTKLRVKIDVEIPFRERRLDHGSGGVGNWGDGFGVPGHDAPPCKTAIPSRGVRIRLSEKAVYPIAGDQAATLRMGHDELARRSVVLHWVVFFRKRTSILGGRNCINQQSRY